MSIDDEGRKDEGCFFGLECTDTNSARKVLVQSHCMTILHIAIRTNLVLFSRVSSRPMFFTLHLRDDFCRLTTVSSVLLHTYITYIAHTFEVEFLVIDR